MTHNDNCKGCARSQETDAIVELPGDWIVNHYAGEEGFLGWLALQPRYHRMAISDLTDDELRHLMTASKS